MQQVRRPRPGVDHPDEAQRAPPLHKGYLKLRIDISLLEGFFYFAKGFLIGSNTLSTLAPRICRPNSTVNYFDGINPNHPIKLGFECVPSQFDFPSIAWSDYFCTLKYSLPNFQVTRNCETWSKIVSIFSSKWHLPYLFCDQHTVKSHPVYLNFPS